MISVKINGEFINLKSDIFVDEFLDLKGYDKIRVAIEKDGKILPKSFWKTTKISDAKSYEIVEFVGGG
ncbi:MAG: sulfur carrier protein ThiS [Campylobacter sp.]|nr:sulfur carrier protein ThiS [Campylobacter sp.]